MQRLGESVELGSAGISGACGRELNSMLNVKKDNGFSQEGKRIA